jgi:CHAT domain-containing protein/tetratricopeptide (TPR) repeat protein
VEEDDTLIQGLQLLQNELNEWNAKLMATNTETYELAKSSDVANAQKVYTQWEQLLHDFEHYYDDRHAWLERHAAGTQIAAFWEKTGSTYKSQCFNGMGLAFTIYRQPSESRALFEQALSLLGDEPIPLKVTLLQTIGATYQLEGKVSKASEYEAQVNAELLRYDSLTVASQQLREELKEWNAKLMTTTVDTSALIVSTDRANAQQAYAQWEQLLHDFEHYYDDRHAWVEQNTAGSATDTAAFWEGQINEHKSECFYGMGMAFTIYRQPSEARALFEQALSLVGDEPTLAKVGALQGISHTYQLEGKVSKASEYEEQANQALKASEYEAQVDAELLRLKSQHSAHPSSDTQTGQEFLSPEALFARERAKTLVQSASDAASKGSSEWSDRLEEAHTLTEQCHLDDELKKVCLKWVELCVHDPECFSRESADVEITLLYQLGSEASCSNKWAQRCKEFIDDEAFHAQLDRSLARHFVDVKDYQKARQILSDALDKARQTHDLLLKKGVLEDLADVNERLGFKAEQISNLKEAYRAVKDISEHASQTLTSLVIAEIDSERPDESALKRHMDCLQQIAGESGLTDVLLQQAFEYFSNGERSRALEVINRALVYSGEEQGPMALFGTVDRITLLYAKGIVLWEMDRLEDALRANEEAIAVLNSVLPDAIAESAKTYPSIPLQWQTVIKLIGSVHMVAACLNATLGNARAAFECAENGNARLLRSQLGIAQVGSAAVGPIDTVSVDQIRASLPPKSALAVFCVTNKGTAVLVLDANKPEPSSTVVPVTAHDLAFARQSDHALEWEEIAAGLPRLSGLIAPLWETAQEYDVIYLIPDSLLFTVPFAALRFDDGTTLLDHCAIAYAPSATVLARCLSEPRAGGHSCLAVAVGDPCVDDLFFADRAKNIASDTAWLTSCTLIDQEATPERVLNESQHYSVTHVTCHGNADPNAADTLRGSSLMLADKAHPLTAYDVYTRGQLQAELVFLDACLSGTIVHPFGSEVGGFWNAFLHAGTSSLIATLVSVDERAADFVAKCFYSNWLHKGMTKAEALRQSQLQMRAQVDNPYWWATHVLVGDHR